MSKNTLAHVAWDCKFHIVIIPKYQYKVFTREVKEAIRDELKKLCVWLQIEIKEGHVSKDQRQNDQYVVCNHMNLPQHIESGQPKSWLPDIAGQPQLGN